MTVIFYDDILKSEQGDDYMSRIKEIFKSQTYPALLLALTVIGLIFFYAGRMNWIFIELISYNTALSHRWYVTTFVLRK